MIASDRRAEEGTPSSARRFSLPPRTTSAGSGPGAAVTRTRKHRLPDSRSLSGGPTGGASGYRRLFTGTDRWPRSLTVPPAPQPGRSVTRPVYVSPVSVRCSPFWGPCTRLVPPPCRGGPSSWPWRRVRRRGVPGGGVGRRTPGRAPPIGRRNPDAKSAGEDDSLPRRDRGKHPPAPPCALRNLLPPEVSRIPPHSGEAMPQLPLSVSYLSVSTVLHSVKFRYASIYGC